MVKRLCISISVVLMLVVVPAPVASSPQTKIFRTERARSHGWLGVEVQDVSRRIAEKKNLKGTQGAYVTEVTEDSPAESAGIIEGDVIVKLDGSAIDGSDDLISAMRHKKAKTDVKVEVIRNSEHKEFTVKLGKTPNVSAYSFGFGDMPIAPKAAEGPMHFSFSSRSDIDGLDVQKLTRQLADYFEAPDHRGLLVMTVKKGSSAEGAGFKAGDVLVTVDGSKISDIGDLHEAIRNDEKEHDVECTIIRKGKSTSLKWHITEEDEDDLSYNLPNLRMKAPDVHREIMDRLREQLDHLRLRLRHGFNNLKQSIRDQLFAS